MIFAYHGYPWLIHRLTYRRTNHHNIHVRGYKEEGTTTTPFDMVMMNDLDRYHLVMDVIDRVPGLGSRAAGLRQLMGDTRRRARAWTREHGEDLPEVRDWSWDGAQPEQRRVAVDHRAAGVADRRQLRPGQREQVGDLAGDRQLLVGRYDEHGRAGRLRAHHRRAVGRAVALRVDLDAQRGQARQRVLSQPGRVLADASGEDDRVGAAEHGQVGADVLPQPVAVDVVRQARVARRRRRPAASGRGSR